MDRVFSLEIYYTHIFFTIFFKVYILELLFQRSLHLQAHCEEWLQDNRLRLSLSTLKGKGRNS